VADFHSDDCPLAEWLEKEAGPMPCRRLDISGSFSRGRGMNEAVRAARSPLVLIYDADMVMSEEAFITALSILAKREAFFPIIQNLDQHGETDGWYDASLGMVFLSKETVLTAGGLPTFSNWGGEDEVLYEEGAKTSPVERFKLKGLKHQWHPVACRHQHYTGEIHEDFRQYRRNVGERCENHLRDK
jgi:hypothetical protein